MTILEEIESWPGAIEEVEERILSLWSSPGPTWFRPSMIAREIGVAVGPAEARLDSMEGRGLLRRIWLADGEIRYNISPAGMALGSYFRGIYTQLGVEVAR